MYIIVAVIIRLASTEKQKLTLIMYGVYVKMNKWVEFVDSQKSAAAGALTSSARKLTATAVNQIRLNNNHAIVRQEI